MVIHTLNPTLAGEEAEARGSLCVPGQPELYIETLCQKERKKEKKSMR